MQKLYQVRIAAKIAISVIISVVTSGSSSATDEAAKHTLFQAAMKAAKVPGISDESKLEGIRRTLEAFDLTAPPEKLKVLTSRDLAQLLRSAADLEYSPDPQEHAQRLSRRCEAMAKLQLQVRSEHQAESQHSAGGLIFLSAGLLGMKVDQHEVINILGSLNTAPEIRLVAAEALLKQDQIVPEAREVFLKMTTDSWSYVEYNDVGPQNPHKVYPLRDKAYEGLLRLNVKCRRVLKDESSIDSTWNMKFTETIIELMK